MTKQAKQMTSAIAGLAAGGFVASSVTLSPLPKALLVVGVVTVVSATLLLAWASRPAA